MITPFRLLLCACLINLTLLNPLRARSSNWTDLQGTTFKGSPSASYGPFALFNTGPNKGRRVLFRSLSPEDCIRYYEESQKLTRAEDWSQAKSSVSYDLKDRLLRLEKDQLVPVNVKGVPEPELYVLIFSSAWEGDSYAYTIPFQFRAAYDRLQRIYPNRMATVHFGVRQDKQSDLGFAKATFMPWLIANYTELAAIDVFARNAPAQGCVMALVTRDGVLLAQSPAGNLQEVKKFIDELNAIMAAGDEQNPLFWKERAYHQSIIRPHRYATSSTPPMLIGNPLRTSTLRKNGVKQVIASMEIDAEGKVTAINVSNAAEIPAAFLPKLEKALNGSAVFLPAIQQGKPVAGTFAFNYTVPGDSADYDVDRDWIILSARPEIIIPTWLLLRPIPVALEEFSKIDQVKDDETVVLNAMKVSSGGISKKAQLNAFNSDFFNPNGADSIAPVEGKTELVDENSYTWERFDSPNGFVNLRAKVSCDYSVGYAWAEFDSPAAGPAFLGLGSDDGVKVWLNGVLVVDRWTRRMSRIDDDIVPLQLVAGKNRILIKIQNATGDWSFLARLRR